MTYSRHQIKDALEDALVAAALEATYNVIPDPRDLGEFDPAYSAILQIVRQVVKPNPPNPRGAYEESVELWLLVANPDPAIAEDLLDDRLREVFDLLDSTYLAFATVDRAERGIHKSGNKHAYKITLKITTDRTPE